MKKNRPDTDYSEYQFEPNAKIARIDESIISLNEDDNFNQFINQLEAEQLETERVQRNQASTQENAHEIDATNRFEMPNQLPPPPEPNIFEFNGNIYVDEVIEIGELDNHNNLNKFLNDTMQSAPNNRSLESDSQLLLYCEVFDRPYLSNQYSELFDIKDVVAIEPSIEDIALAQKLSQILLTIHEHEPFQTYINTVFNYEFYQQRKSFVRQVQFFKSFCTHMIEPFCLNKKDDLKEYSDIRTSKLFFNILKEFPAEARIKLFSYALQTYPTFVFLAMQARAFHERDLYMKKNPKKNFDFFFHHYFLVFITNINISSQLCTNFEGIVKHKVISFLNCGFDVLEKIDTKYIMHVIKGVIVLYHSLLSQQQVLDQTNWRKFLEQFMARIQSEPNADAIKRMIYQTLVDVSISLICRSDLYKIISYVLKSVDSLLQQLNCPRLVLLDLLETKMIERGDDIIQVIGIEQFNKLIAGFSTSKARHRLNNNNRVSISTVNVDTVNASLNTQVNIQVSTEIKSNSLHVIETSNNSSIICNAAINEESETDVIIPFDDSQLIKRYRHFPVPYLNIQHRQIYDLNDVTAIKPSEKDLAFAEKLADKINLLTTANSLEDYCKTVLNDEFYKDRQKYKSQVQFFKSFLIYMNLNRQNIKPIVATKIFDILAHFPAYTQIKLFSYALHHYTDYICLLMQMIATNDNTKYNKFSNERYNTNHPFYFHHYFLTVLTNVNDVTHLTNSIICIGKRKALSFLHNGIDVLYNIDPQDIIHSLKGVMTLYQVLLYNFAKHDLVTEKWSTFCNFFIPKHITDSIILASIPKLNHQAIAQLCFLHLRERPKKYEHFICIMIEHLYNVQCSEAEIIAILKQKITEHEDVISENASATGYKNLLNSVENGRILSAYKLNWKGDANLNESVSLKTLNQLGSIWQTMKPQSQPIVSQEQDASKSLHSSLKQ